MQSPNVLLNDVLPSNESYGQMASMSSGCNNTYLNSNNPVTSRSSFRESSGSFNIHKNENIDSAEPKDNSTSDSNADLYNLPWDLKKTNQLLSQAQLPGSTTKSTSMLKCSPTPPPPPQCPPPSSINKNEDDEDQYCAPWDLKLQEEMFKKMSQGKKNETGTVQNSPKSEDNMISEKANAATASDLNNSIKSNNSTSDLSSKQPLQQALHDSPSNEYSPPWELKQTVLMQSLQSQSSLKAPSQQSQQQTQIINNMPAPLSTSSTVSTLTNNQNQNASALSSLFQQFSRTRLSTRSNTSSSSSTRSSTSSLSASSPPSIPPPPLPPSIPPPPPPTTSNVSISRCGSTCSHSHHVHQQMSHQSPRLSQRHLCQTSSSSNLSTNGNNPRNGNPNGFQNHPALNHMNSSCNTCSLKKNVSNGQNQSQCTINNNINNTLLTTMTNTNSLLTNSSYLNESNKFCSWGSNSSSNTNSFENNNCASSIDDPKAFSRQSRGGSSHHFAYPAMTNHFQTVSSTNGQIQANDSKNIQLARPVTALVFSQTSSLPTNLLPLNIQHQQMGNQQHPTVPSLISPASLSHLHLLERQIWFHGKITRKHAEKLLENRPIGSFLIRQSESGNSNDFSLSLVGSGSVHMRISIKNGEYILGQCSQPFNSIVKMVEHYGKVEVPIKGALHVKLTIPVPAS